MDQTENILNFSDEFLHIRILTGMIVSLCMSRLLGNLATLIQHPKKRIYSGIQIVWMLNAMLWMIEWWWTIFDFRNDLKFTYSTYLILIFYSVLDFFIVFLITPDNIDEYKSFDDYFISIRKLLYILCIMVATQDVALETAFIENNHFIRLFSYSSFAIHFVFYLLAMISRNLRFQFAVAVLGSIMTILGIVVEIVT